MKRDDLYQEGFIDDVFNATNIKNKFDDVVDDLGKIKKEGDENSGSKYAKKAEDIGKAVSRNKIDGRSIVARARNSVLQFPIYVTKSIRVNEAQIIAKLFERVYTTLVQTVLAQHPIINEDEANDLVFLKQFHSNLKESADLVINEYYEPIDGLDEMMQESVFYSEQISPTCTVEFKCVPTVNKDLIMENARLLHEPLYGLNYLKEANSGAGNNEPDDDAKRKEEEKKFLKKVNGAEVKEYNSTSKYVQLSEKDLEEMAIDAYNISGDTKKLHEMSHGDIEKEVKQLHADLSSSDIADKIQEQAKKKAAADDTVAKAVSKYKEKIKKNEIKGIKYENNKFFRLDKQAISKSHIGKAADIKRAVDAPKILRDADIKKINGMLPYTIEASFRVRSKNGGLDTDVHYIIGIKSVMHLIDVQDLSDDLHELVTGKIKSLQKVRYKTGEIGFMDYMFNVKGLKADASKRINYSKRWINTLKRLGDYEKMHGSLFNKPSQLLRNGNIPIPNGTIILSQTDVTTLANTTGIDLSSVANAKRLAKSLFLIAVCIVDASAGTMKVLFTDSDTDWDVQSLSSIDAEVSKTDNSQLMKELNKMVNR